MPTNYQFSIAPPSQRLEVHPSGRYLRDAGNKEPVYVRGDTAWSLFTELTLAEVRAYLDDRAARGFNAIRAQTCSTIPFADGQSAPFAVGASGQLPFSLNTSGGAWTGVFVNHDPAFSAPNNTYWNWVDTVISEARRRGLQVILDWLYLGARDGIDNEGFWNEINNAHNTQSVCFAFGQYLGARWAAHPNLILTLGTDRFPDGEGSARFLKILDGLQDAGCAQLVTAHYARSSDALEYSTYASRVHLNAIYPGASTSVGFSPTHGRARAAYARSPAKPAFVIESIYWSNPAVEVNLDRTQTRALGWWGQLESTAGYVWGQTDVWKFVGDWQSELGSVGCADFTVMGTFIKSLPHWQLLVPRNQGSIGTLVTAGGGSAQTIDSSPPGPDGTDGTDWVSAAATPDGSLLVAYRPNGHSGTFTVDMTKMRGTTVRRWFDPVLGTYQSAGADLPNTGTQAFTAPAARGDGSKDWVLRLDA